jgi:S1-C subfamily serine protease
MLARISTVLLASLVLHPISLQGQTSPPTVDLSETYQQVISSVVYIEVGNIFERTGSGSGFILHADGYIATAAHLVEDADIVRVTFRDETSSQARIVTMSRAQDLALLKVASMPDGVQPANLGVMSKVSPGQSVFCIGAPHDLRFSITSGIVSAVRDNSGMIDIDAQHPSRLLQTDTAINPGNSGGPIFNHAGEVIGIAVGALTDADGIGWAVPVDMIRHYLVDQAVPFGGVVYLRVTPEFSGLMNWLPSEALIVERVQAGSLAEKNGLRGGQIKANFGRYSIMLGGDVIYFIGGHPVSDHQKVREYLRALKEEDEIKLKVWRAGTLVELRAPFKILDPLPSIEIPGADLPASAGPGLQNRKARWISPAGDS